jgi:hypothetical protein
MHLLRWIINYGEERAMKLSLLLMAAAAASLASAQDTSKPVDYTTRAKPISVVLSELSKKTGLKLTCTAELDSEPVILRFQGVPLKEAMDKIALVFAGDWRKQPDGFELVRGKKAEQLHAAVIQTYADDFAAAVKNLAKERGLDVPYTASTAGDEIKDLFRSAAGPAINPEIFNHVSDKSPLVRLLVRVLAKMNPKDVVSSTLEGPCIYSNQPTSLQAPLSVDLRDAFDQYSEEQGILDGAVANISGEPKDKTDWAHQYFSYGSRDPVARVLLTLSGSRGRYYAGLLLADASGKIIDEGSVDVNSNSDAKANALEQSKIYRNAKVTTPLGPVALDILPNINNQENFRRVKADTAAVLLAPTETEPLAIATSDVVLGLAAKDNVNVAVLPPDDSNNWCYVIGRSGKVSLAAFEQQAAYSKELDVSEENGWLIGSPTDPLEIARLRLSRPALEGLLNSIATSRTIGIDARAQFEANAGPNSSKALADEGTMALYNYSFYDSQTGSEPCLALLGTLSGLQRQTAAQDTLRVSQNMLSEQQTAYLHQWLLGYGVSFQPVASQAVVDRSVDARGFPTEVLAKAEASNGYLEVTDRKKLEFDMKETQDGVTSSYGCDIDSLARLSAETEHPDMFPKIVGFHLDAIKMGGTRDVTVSFVVGDRKVTETLTEYDAPAKSDKGVPLAQLLDQLPAETRQAYTQAIEKYRAQFASGKPE